MDRHGFLIASLGAFAAPPAGEGYTGEAFSGSHRSHSYGGVATGLARMRPTWRARILSVALVGSESADEPHRDAIAEGRRDPAT
jgi:hypothetical protein